MNANFKPIVMAAAVASVAAGYAGVTNAQVAAPSGALAAETLLGDLAIVPYYTVEGDYATGVNIINTSGQTQAIKIRFRRAPDSMDALDFNVVLSPYDVYNGYVTLVGDDIKFVSNDNSCTAPAYPEGGFVMPAIYRNNAETGYIEVLSMGSPLSESSAVAQAAKHGATGVPADCARVRDNFFAGGVSGTTKGNVNSKLTVMRNIGVSTLVDVNWKASENSLKVSYFIKSDETGVEFGNAAVHVENYFDGPSMTNQQTGVFSGDLQGFDHPDLNGGAPQSIIDGVTGVATLGLYDSLRGTLGAESLLNNWSANLAGPFSVDTDWVVTIPGQYVMLDLPGYLAYLDDPETYSCLGDPDVPACDNRDIPMKATFTVYDREEQGIVVQEGDLVVSPQPPGEVIVDVLDKEVNVIQWGTSPVLNAPAFIEVLKPEGADAGWASLSAESSDAKRQSICEYTGVSAGIDALPLLPAMDCYPVTSPAPLVGFVAWQRNFDALPAANYGRIVEHSRVQSSSVAP